MTHPTVSSPRLRAGGGAARRPVRLLPALLPAVLLLCLLVMLASGLARRVGPARAAGGTTAPGATPPPPEAAQVTPLPGAPVRLGGQTLFYLYQRIGPLSPAERAALINQKLETLADDPFAPPLEIVVVESDHGMDLMAGELVLMTVTAADARAVNLPPEQAAQTAARLMQEAVQRYRQERTPLARVTHLLMAVAILSVLGVGLYLLNRLFKGWMARLEQGQAAAGALPAGGGPAGGASGGDEIIADGLYRSGFWRRLVRLLFNLARLAVLLAAVFIAAPLVLRQFPLTAEIANQLAGFLNNALSAVWIWFSDNQGNLLTILLIGLVTYGLTHLVSTFFGEVAQGGIRLRGFEPEWAPFTRRIINFLLLVGAVMVAFPYIPGSDSDAFRAISIFLGALFTLSSTAAVTNIVAGIIQTYTGAFRVGDVVRVGETTGTVIEKRLLTTRVRTFKQEEVSIPNSVVMSASVVNYSVQARTSGLILYTTVTIGYNTPWQQVQAALLCAAANTAHLLADPPPFVLQTALNDYHISYQLNCYTKRPDIMPRLYSELHQNIQEAFNQAGIEIMSPAYTALRDGSAVTLPG